MALLKVLVFSEDRAFKDALKESLPHARYVCDEVRDKIALLHALGNSAYRLVILDARTVAGDMDVVSLLREHGNHHVLFVVPENALASAVEAIRRGADFYLTWPWRAEVFRQVLAEWEREVSAGEARWEPADLPVLGDGAVVGNSEALRKVFYLAERVAPTDSAIMITGETGVGKEMVARAIHRLSPRADKTFVAVNCGAIPETLLESELFGFRKGAFTGAVADRAGLFEQANGGTFFLDEVGELSPAMQVKLLRVLEDGRIRRLGASEDFQVDVRVLAATNRDLREEVKSGRFREDLYYRLNVIAIHISPLRERREDIAPLLKFFLAKYNQRFKQNVISINRDALFILMNYDYPGNVRELENIVQYAVLLSDHNIINKVSLPPQIFQRVQLAIGGPKSDHVISLQKTEEEQIKNALLKYNGNQTEAAKSLGISRSTLWRKIKTYQLENFK
ncbi:MAG: sigma-54-dependent Fis family transcriptional regulator [Candidatus Firestonebacteria bacterium]|nr:sigma-54-dependent Fis family transcriptional regulator [Candidatus Firestonebacteria bacterium]